MANTSLSEIINKCKQNGWRCLLSIIGEKPLELDGIDGYNLCISRNGEDHFSDYGIKCSKLVDYPTAHQLLGEEYGNVFLSLKKTRGWPGNLVALSAEYVGKGGVYGLIIPEHLAETTFGKYFLEKIRRSKNYIIITTNKIEYKIYKAKPPVTRTEIPRTNDRILNKLLPLAKTKDQIKGLRSFPVFLYNKKYKLYLIHGDRGRGKSGLLGLLASYIIYRRKGKYAVTSRSLYSVQSFFKLLSTGLKVLGVQHEKIKKENMTRTVIISGKGMIKYAEPWKLDPSRYDKPLLIDEAAGAGLARLRRWYNNVGKIVASSTIHGYEGSGRTLLRYLNEYFKSTMKIRLSQPIRYYPGDPLEEVIYDIFYLNAEPKPIELDNSYREEPEYIELPGKKLAENPDLLGEVYGLLVSAHYRNEPDDLVILLDTEYFNLIIQKIRDKIIGVAQTRKEEYINGQITDPKGMLLTNTLERLGVLEALKKKDHSLIRIVRIAVNPSIQRRGYGSKLLRYIEDKYRDKHDLVGAIFSGFNTLFFWTKNNYLPIYISPRYNKITGEKNIAVLKPLSKTGETTIHTAASILLQRIYYAGHILFRDVGVEKLTEILRIHRSKNIDLPSKKLDCLRLQRFIKDQNQQYEAIIDIVYKYFLSAGIDSLSREELEIVTGRILLGKEITDLAKIYMKKPDKIVDIIEKSIRRITEELHLRLCSS